MINKNALKYCGVTEEDYYAWCRENKKPSYLLATKKEFFLKIHKEKLTRDSNGKIVEKKKI